MAKNQITIVTRVIQNGLTGFGEQILNAIDILEGKRAKITIEEFRRPRTNKQNRYYWGVVLKAYCQYFERQGHYFSNDEMHLWIKEYVWGDFQDITVEKVDRDGVITYLPMRHILSSTTLDTLQFEERMFLSRAYAAENFDGLQIPEPSEKIDAHVLEWLENPEGIYYQNEYKDYFNIIQPHEISEQKQ